MKKLVSIVTMLTLVLGLCACGSTENAVSENGNDAVTNVKQESTEVTEALETIEVEQEKITEESSESQYDIIVKSDEQFLLALENVLNSDIQVDSNKFESYLNETMTMMEGLDVEASSSLQSDNLWGYSMQFYGLDGLIGNVRYLVNGAGDNLTKEEVKSNNYFVATAFGDNLEKKLNMETIMGFPISADNMLDFENCEEWLNEMGKPDYVLVNTMDESQDKYVMQVLLTYTVGDYGMTVTIQSGYGKGFYDNKCYRYISEVKLYNREVYSDYVLELMKNVKETKDLNMDTTVIESNEWYRY